MDQGGREVVHVYAAVIADIAGYILNLDSRVGMQRAMAVLAPSSRRVFPMRNLAHH